MRTPAVGPDDIMQPGPEDWSDENRRKRWQSEAETITVNRGPTEDIPLPPEVWPVPPEEALR